MDFIESLRMSLDWVRVFLLFLIWRLIKKQKRTGGRLEAGDISVFYRRFGSGDPIVLLHGGFSFAEFWAGQFPALHPLQRHARRLGQDMHDVFRRGDRLVRIVRDPQLDQHIGEPHDAEPDLAVGPRHPPDLVDGGLAHVDDVVEKPHRRPHALRELERNLRLAEEVLRFLLVRADE